MAETPRRRVLHNLIIGVLERVFGETPTSITSSSCFDAAFLLSRQTWTNDSDERLRGCGCGSLQANPGWNRGLSRQRGLRWKYPALSRATLMQVTIFFSLFLFDFFFGEPYFCSFGVFFFSFQNL